MLGAASFSAPNEPPFSSSLLAGQSKLAFHGLRKTTTGWSSILLVYLIIGMRSSCSCVRWARSSFRQEIRYFRRYHLPTASRPNLVCYGMDLLAKRWSRVLLTLLPSPVAVFLVSEPLRGFRPCHGPPLHTNAMTVKAGETELWFAMIKTLVIIALIVAGADSPLNARQQRHTAAVSNPGHHGGLFPTGLSGFLGGS